MNERLIVQHLQQSLPGLLAVYAFGSRAQGTANQDSDLDLAVLVDGKPDPVELWELAADLADMAGCTVDLLDLSQASTVMQHQIITSGRRLWAKGMQASLYECFILSEKTALDTARAGLLEDIGREGRVYGR